MKDLLRVLVCGDNASGAASLAARLSSAPGHEGRHTAVVDTSDPWLSTPGLAAAAITSEVAILALDPRSGLTAETRRHLHLLFALRVDRIVIALTQAAEFEQSEADFVQFHQECADIAARLGAAAPICVLVSADRRDHIEQLSSRMSWYQGPTLFECLASVESKDPAPGIRVPTSKAELASQFEATIVWTSDRPMLQSRSYQMRVGTVLVSATVAPLKYRVDSDTLRHVPAKTLGRGDVGVCSVELDQSIDFDPSSPRFSLHDAHEEIVGVVRLHFALHRSQNVKWQALDIDKHARAALMRQRPCVVWFTGLSGAGKSTIANLVEKRLHTLGRHTYLLDGDNVRHGLNKDLGFTDADRVENIRRVAEVARLMVDAGLVVLVSFISPFRSERRMARALVAEGEFIEVFVDTPLEVAESRDSKGLYLKARRGELKNFTGVDSPYEVPEHAELRVDTTRLTAEECAQEILHRLERMGIVA